MQPPIYEAKATVMVGRSIENPNPSSNDLFLSQQLAQTYVEIARRRPVQDAAMAALGIGELPHYSVSLVPNTQLLEIKVYDSDPQRAQAVGNELANQLIKQSPDTQGKETQERREFLTQEVQDLEKNINTTRARIQELTKKLADMFSAREISDTQSQINALEQNSPPTSLTMRPFSLFWKVARILSRWSSRRFCRRNRSAQTWRAVSLLLQR